ncbi:MAG: hypothetical protein HY909_09395 [Deltaproteobacteria bacterium]|nr:hypothetical protein [Deltaproteobacteria bacterium]
MDINKIPESPWVRAWRLELEAKGKAEAVLAVLTARGIPVTAAQAALVLGCKDRARLDGWLQAVASVASAEQLLGPSKVS